jgi:hypothetical protein
MGHKLGAPQELETDDGTTKRRPSALPAWGLASSSTPSPTRSAPTSCVVLTRIALRLRTGATVYGTLQVAFDERNFRSEEAREELEDALVYLACAWLKAESAL